VAVLQPCRAHDHYTDSRRIRPQGPARRPSHNHLERAVPAQTVAVVVSGEGMAYPELLQQRQLWPAPLDRQIEVVVLFLGIHQEPRVVLEDNQVTRRGSPGFPQFDS